MPADRGLACERGVGLSGSRSWCGSQEGRVGPSNQECSPRVPTTGQEDPTMKVMIGVDPHKGSHTATMLDWRQRELRRITVRAGSGQVGELLAWADDVKPRT